MRTKQRIGGLFFALFVFLTLTAQVCVPSGEDNPPPAATTPTPPTPTATTRPGATATPTPPPAATATPPPAVPTATPGGIRTQSVPTWPKTPEEAASTFGATADRWETSAEGGWHLREEAFTTLINPRGFLAEGYFDTKPGKNPQCMLFKDPIGIQGGTIWPEAGTRQAANKLFGEMAVPIWQDGSRHPCQIMIP